MPEPNEVFRPSPPVAWHQPEAFQPALFAGPSGNNLIRTASDTLTAFTESVTRAAQTFLRTASETAGQFTETASRLTSAARTAVDTTLVQFTETVSRLTSAPRTATDTINALTESATRAAQSFLRTATDTVGSFVETAARIVSGSRTASDTSSALVEVAIGAKTVIRTASDTLTQFTETALRGAMSFLRTISDTIASLAEATGRITAASRTASDTIGALVETATRAAQAFVRTAADTLGALTETVARGAMAFLRTASDTLGGFTEAATRSAQAFIRTANETLTALTEVAIGLKVVIRTATDSLTQLTETAAKSAQTFLRSAAEMVAALTESAARTTSASRTVTDTLNVLSETVAGLKIILRTAADTLGALAETVSRAGTAARSATETLGAMAETVATMLSLSRAASETLGALAEMATVIRGLVRTAADAIGVLAETATGAINTGHHFVRTATDNLAQLVEIAILERVFRLGRAAASVVEFAKAVGTALLASNAAASAGAAGVSYPSAVLADNPIAYWKLQEASGTTAADVRGLASGTINGGVTLGAPDLLLNDPSTAMLFNGSTGWLNMGNPASLAPSSDLSFEWWGSFVTTADVWMGGRCSIYPVGGLQAAGDLSYGFEIGSIGPGIVSFYTSSDGSATLGSLREADSTLAYNDGRPHHFVGTWVNGGPSVGTIKFYVDGALVATVVSGFGSHSGTYTGTSNVQFAKPPTNTFGVAFFPGTLDEIAVYNYALTAAQVARHFVAGQKASTAGGGAASIVS